MMNKKINVLDRLKKESFKKKESPTNVENKEFEITVVEKETFKLNDTIFDYNQIEDNDMKNDLIKYEQMLLISKNNYHSKVGAILLEANNKYSHKKNGVFGSWLTHMQIGKKSAERLINRYLFMCNNLKTSDDISYFESLPLSLTYEVSSPSASKELVDAVLNKKIKTRKEYLSLKSLLSTKKTDYSTININELIFNLNNNLNNLIKTNDININPEKVEVVCKKINSLNNEILNLLKKI